jgi:hypothetical protein
MNEFLWKSRFIETAYEAMSRHGIDVFDALAAAERLAEREYTLHPASVPEIEASTVCRTVIAL